jgi:hypothetical protein
VTDKQDSSATDKPEGSAVAAGGLILNAVKAIQEVGKWIVGTTAGDDEIWRIEWKDKITFGVADDIPGYYVLHNKSNAGKYKVSAEAPSGKRNTWHAIYEQSAKRLDSPYEPKSDEQKPFIVRWRAGQGRFSRVRKRTVWGQ